MKPFSGEPGGDGPISPSPTFGPGHGKKGKEGKLTAGKNVVEVTPGKKLPKKIPPGKKPPKNITPGNKNDKTSTPGKKGSQPKPIDVGSDSDEKHKMITRSKRFKEVLDTGTNAYD